MVRGKRRGPGRSPRAARAKAKKITPECLLDDLPYSPKSPSRGGENIPRSSTNMPLSNPISRVPGAVALLSLAGALWPTSTVAGSVGGDGGEGYKLGDEVPVSCLNRTL